LERRALPADCAGEAAMRAKEQSELPRLEVASPADRRRTASRWKP
jgi:hypothetical protein